MHGRDRATELKTDVDSFGGAENGPLFEELLEGVAANELHPEADLVANLLGAVDGDDIRMAYTGEQSAFVDDRRRCAISHVSDRPAGASARPRDRAAYPRRDRPLQTRPGRSARGAAGEPTSPACPNSCSARGRRKERAPRPRGERRWRSARLRGASSRLAEACAIAARKGGDCASDLSCPTSGCALPSALDSAAAQSMGSRRGSRRRDRQSAAHSAARFISSASRTSARCAVLRAASGVGLPSASASSS